jgi:hypothetical protein
MFVRSICGALVFTLMVPMMAMAQQAAPEPTTKEDMKLAAEKDVGYGADTSFLTWHGYLDLEFTKGQQENSAFDLHEFYLSAKAQIASKVSVTGEFEYEHAPQEFVLPLQAYVDYAVHPAFNVRGGLFFAPIGLPRAYTLRGNKNRMVRQVALTTDLLFEDWSDRGVNVFGQFRNGLYYDVAVTNGIAEQMAPGDRDFSEDEDEEAEHEHESMDNNSNKAVFLRTGFARDLPGASFNVAVSYAAQKYDDDNEREMTNVGADVRYLHRNGLRLQAEFAKRSGDDNEEDLEHGISADAYGWLFQASKRQLFNNGASYFEPVFQIDAIDLNKNEDTNSDKTVSAIGLVISPVKNYLIKFEYDWVKENHGEPVRNNKLWIAMVAEF